jgi:DNA-binding PadR family transcriptional regulator
VLEVILLKIDKGLIGGSTVLLILTLLDEADKYGYEIIKELDNRSDKTFQFKEGTLYPVLHKLENKGYIKSYMTKGETGRQRKYYQITKKGKKQFIELKEKWNLSTVSVNKVLGGDFHVIV